MKNLFKKSTLAVAVSLVLGSSAVWAQEVPGVIETNVTDPTDSTIKTKNKTDVSLTKDITVTKTYNQKGDVTIAGKILVDSSSMATVDDKQLNYNNNVKSGQTSTDPVFNATTGAISGNAGNVGINVTAGVNNQQDNAAAISSANSPVGDLAFVLGSTDAEIYTHQSVWDNRTKLIGAQLTAATGVIDANTGNLGVNVSAGVSNLQKNNLAISVGSSGLAEASSATLQETTNLDTEIVDSAGDVFGRGAVNTTYTSTLGAVTGNAGNIGVNLASGSNNLQANSLSISAVTP